MPRHSDLPAELSPEVRDAVVTFLRDWLPDEAKRVYRRMMAQDEAGWMNDPHFGGGFIVQYALRGNGLDERALGVRDLETLWPDLLRRAVLGEDAAAERPPEPCERRRRIGP